MPTANPYVTATSVNPPSSAGIAASELPRESTAGPTAVAATPMGVAPSPALTPDQGLVPASQAPAVALEGYCPVTLLEQRNRRG